MKSAQLAAAAILALGATAICAHSAEAQAAVASPFHAGQWGIEAYATGAGGGVTRFFTPRTALVLTVAAEHQSTSSDDAAGGGTSNRATVIDAALGLRRHSMLAPHIAATLGAGAVAGSIRQEIVYSPSAGTSKYRGSYLGAYVEVGGQYVIADHFAVGFAYRAMGEHLKVSPSGEKGSAFQMAFLPIRATLYF